MLIITDKQDNILAVWSGDIHTLATIYPNNPDVYSQYNEYQMPDDKDILANPKKYQITNGKCVIKQETMEEKLIKIRQQRDSLLRGSDFTQLPDVPLTDIQKTQWQTYRQQLRDFPSTCDVNNPIWPTKPV